MLLVEVVRRAVCLPLALAGFSVINVDLDVLLPPPFSCQAVFITIEKKRRPSLEIAECSVVTVFIRCSARERRRMPIMQHIPCPTSSSSRLQTKRALTCLPLEWWGENSSQPRHVSKGLRWSGRQQTIPARKLRQKRRPCFATTVTLFLPLFHWRWWCFVVRGF